MFQTMKQTAFVALASALAAVVTVAQPAHAQLNGAGATFPAPLYQRWFQEYNAEKHVTINYQPIGSGGGIKQITAHSVDFGASDAPMSAGELGLAPGIIHIPTVAGAVAISYNVPGMAQGLKLTGPVIADIFLGKVTKWNDPEISKLNPGVALPGTGIYPVHRSDGSGTTNVFTTYLSEVSGTWKADVGAGKSVTWTKGPGGKGNSGVAALVKQNEGGIGYLELNYAIANHIDYASVRNAKGKYILPSVESTTVAAEGSTLPPDFRKVITNTSAVQGYPITGFTFLLFYPNSKPELKSFLEWALGPGQKDAATLYYAPLPENVRERALKAVARIK
jgi:phosphate transport system substrate-binding protein